MSDEKPRRSRLYKIALGFAGAFIASALLSTCAALLSKVDQLFGGDPPVPDIENMSHTAGSESEGSVALVISLGALLVTGLGTVSTAMLGWRKERRDAAEARLRIEHLELQLEEVRRQQGRKH